MKKLAIVAATIAITACTSTGAPVASGSAPFAPASDFNAIGLPQATFDSPLAAAQHFARYDGGEEGIGTFDLSTRRAGVRDGIEMVFSVEGYADDSVRGEQWRIVVTPANPGWRVVEAGQRYSCYRGANPGSWQKGLCP